MELVTMFLGTLHYVGVVAILFSIQVVVCTSWNSAECKNPFNCGLIKNVSYPFHQIRGCGKPGFEFVCPDDGSPVITIGSRSYQVLVYNTSLQSLTIAPVSKYGDVLCPENLSNISLNLSPFYPASNTNNISLYYDCPANATQYEGLYNHQFNCSTSGGRNDVGYFVVTSSFSQLSVAARDAMASCIAMSSSSIRFNLKGFWSTIQVQLFCAW
ncbi:uncharacterized protein LOC120147669 [Hibiscus syriacus]|uniref:uncharacterized protein LOC120147669 n=1 Tax=Hibiscus syriacus TaxID=106335 RepID=UPI0019223B8F|nr:uncharacterized protein LOC120147669 [Hibiscus syriacus]